MLRRIFENGDAIEQTLFSAERLAEVLRLAERAPVEAAQVPELAIMTTGSFAAASTERTTDRVSVVVWNMERGRRLDLWMDVEAIRRADILILCEVDDGMARSGNVNVPEELARRLGLDYAFAPNYFEFTRGTKPERKVTSGSKNSLGFHGNAILSRWPLREPRRIALPLHFDWYRHYEKRIGTRVGLVAEVETPVGKLSVVAAHLEAFATPAQRATEVRALLRGIPENPNAAIIGGDFNTLGVRPTWLQGLTALAAQWRDAHRRTMGIIPLEPLFRELLDAGFTWEEANPDAPTWGFPHGAPAFHAKLDWVFMRGLHVMPESRAVVPAPLDTGARSGRLSDHDGLTLTVRAL